MLNLATIGLVQYFGNTVRHSFQPLSDAANQAGLPGIWILIGDSANPQAELNRLSAWSRSLRIESYLSIQVRLAGGLSFIHVQPSSALSKQLPEHDTLGIAGLLSLDSMSRDDHLMAEIVMALAMSPIVFPFPDLDEFQASVTVRARVARAANQAELSFDTEGLERPPQYWQYHESTGFVLLPGQDLVEALIHTTQPEVSGKQYSFSCYRASEYAILLGLCQTIREVNPPLLKDIESRWHRQAIMSGEFHDVFLREYGSMDQPMPVKYYVPGDRLWFRNPDSRSSDVEGFEGSWVFYLGGGYFNNFWKHRQPFTFDSKCIEIYHWRHGAYVDASGVLRMNEDIVEANVSQTLADPQEKARILSRMMRMRDPQGVYAEGGCIDSTRESVKWICEGTADITIPYRKATSP